MMKKSLQLIAFIVLSTAVSLAFSETAFALTGFSNYFAGAKNSRLKLTGQVAVGSKKNASCELLAVTGGSDGFSKLYNVMIKSKSLKNPRVFRARDYGSSISANQSEVYFTVANSKTSAPQSYRRVNGQERLQLYQVPDGSFTAIIYQNQNVLLSCVGLR